MNYPLRGRPVTGTMQELALRCGTSKATGHSYMPVYEAMLPERQFPVRLLEIGVYRGESIRMWLEWFAHPDTMVYGVDTCPESVLHDPRYVYHACDQRDAVLGTLFPPESLDVIVDDACHDPPAQRRSFELLWPALKPGGQYWIEDVNVFHPSYVVERDGDILRHWLTMPGCHVWANFMDGHGNYRDDDILVMVEKQR